MVWHSISSSRYVLLDIYRKMSENDNEHDEIYRMTIESVNNLTAVRF